MEIPDGFRLVAKTELPGTGRAVVRGYYHSLRGEFFASVTFFQMEGGLPKERCVPVGPFPKGLIDPLQVTLKDLQDMKFPTYIEE